MVPRVHPIIMITNLITVVVVVKVMVTSTDHMEVIGTTKDMETTVTEMTALTKGMFVNNNVGMRITNVLVPNTIRDNMVLSITNLWIPAGGDEAYVMERS